MTLREDLENIIIDIGMVRSDEQITDAILKLFATRIRGMKVYPNPDAEGSDVDGMREFNQALDILLQEVEGT